MTRKIVFTVLAVLLVAAAGVWYYIFEYSKTHHRDVEAETAITISAAQLVTAFQANETKANSLYLNKVVQIKGEVIKTGLDQEGNITLMLKSDDPFTSVFCTLKKGEKLNTTDTTITLKGICAGFLTNVVLNNGVIINRSAK